MDSSHNKRGYTRVMTQLSATIAVEGSAPVECHVENVSLNGVRLSSGEGLSDGAPCVVRLLLTGIAPPVEITAKGSVIRATPDECAVEFNSMDGDSYEHLRRLVLENANDTDAVETEFDASVGIRRTTDDF